MLDKLHAERLLQVVRVLAELPKEKKFSLYYWSICGSIACAVGWAATDPWFTRRGFHLEKYRTAPREDIASEVRRILGKGKIFTTYQPEYRGWEDHHAAEQFFDLNTAEMQRLFMVSSYKTPTKRHVIRRIKAFVKANT